MKALILAAGVGSRLRPLTDLIPKCMVRVNNKRIIDFQLDAIRKAEISEVIIVTGYMSEILVEYVSSNYTDLKITFINNEKFESTNNMFSFYLAQDLLKNEEFISMNADVAIEDSIISGLKNSSVLNAIGIDNKSYSEESMKITMNTEKKISSISKSITNSDSNGCSIDIYKFSVDASNKMFNIINEYINKNDLNQWTEVALNQLLDKVDFLPYDIDGKVWFEIDSKEDLKEAAERFNYAIK
jgi:L-glutamine-phosphate cytidylyltransferase